MAKEGSPIPITELAMRRQTVVFDLKILDNQISWIQNIQQPRAKEALSTKGPAAAKVLAASRQFVKNVISTERPALEASLRSIDDQIFSQPETYLSALAAIEEDLLPMEAFIKEENLTEDEAIQAGIGRLRREHSALVSLPLEIPGLAEVLAARVQSGGHNGEKDTSSRTASQVKKVISASAVYSNNMDVGVEAAVESETFGMLDISLIAAAIARHDDFLSTVLSQRGEHLPSNNVLDDLISAAGDDPIPGLNRIPRDHVSARKQFIAERRRASINKALLYSKGLHFDTIPEGLSERDTHLLTLLRLLNSLTSIEARMYSDREQSRLSDLLPRLFENEEDRANGVVIKSLEGELMIVRENIIRERRHGPSFVQVVVEPYGNIPRLRLVGEERGDGVPSHQREQTNTTLHTRRDGDEPGSTYDNLVTNADIVDVIRTIYERTVHNRILPRRIPAVHLERRFDDELAGFDLDSAREKGYIPSLRRDKTLTRVDLVTILTLVAFSEQHLSEGQLKDVYMKVTQIDEEIYPNDPTQRLSLPADRISLSVPGRRAFRRN